MQVSSLLSAETIESQVSIKAKRDQFTTEIRRQKLENQLNVKRMKFDQRSKICEESPTIVTPTDVLNTKFMQLAERFRGDLKDNSVQKLEKTLKDIREAISQNSHPPINVLYETKILVHIVSFLTKENFQYEKVQKEATWILVNVCSGESKYCEYVVEELNGITCFINMLSSPSCDVRDLAVWGISNLAGESITYAQIMLERGVVPYLVKLIHKQRLEYSLLRNLVWALNNLSQEKLNLNMQLSPAIPALEKLMACNDDEILSSVLYTLCNICEGSDLGIECIMKLNCLTQFINLAMCESENCAKVRTPALRLIGICLGGEDRFTQTLLELDVMACLKKNLTSKRKIWKKDALWSISNIFCCGSETTEKTLSDPLILPKVFEILYSDTNEVKAEALKCLLQASRHGAYKEINDLVENEILKVMLDVVASKPSSEMLLDVLETLENILNSGNDYAISNEVPNPYLMIIEKLGGVKILEELQRYQDKRVYDRIASFIDAFFDY